MAELQITSCNRQDAEYAVRHWHYSGRLPPCKMVRFAVWEERKFTGVVVFGRPGSADSGKPYRLSPVQFAELIRVALRDGHVTPVSQIIARCLRLLKASNPGLRLVISYADPEHGHHGGIYQSANWIYTGTTGASDEWRVNGRRVHGRAVSHWTERDPPREGETRLAYLQRTRDPRARRIITVPKHRYLYPFDRSLRRQLNKLALPYPAAEASMVMRPVTGRERQVQALPAALEVLG